MKAAFVLLTALMTTTLANVAHAAPPTPAQARKKILALAEVKAVYAVYKGTGWKCQDTVVQVSADGGSFLAEKVCENTKPGHEAGVYMTLKGFIYGEGSAAEVVLDSINWNRAG